MAPMMTRILFSFLAFMVLSLPAAAERLLVFAAASLGGPLDRAAALYEEETGIPVAVSYAGSSVLARQIEAGAPADIFLSANEGWMDHLAALGLIDNASRHVLWRNRLVLVSHAPGDPIDISETTFLPALIGDGKVATGLIDSVPVGVYALEALTKLGAWEALKDQLAQADNARAALALVSSGAAPWGIVYATDAAADPQVHLRGVFPQTSHAEITYPAALIGSAAPEAAGFLEFLATEPAQAIFEDAGFLRAPTP